MTDSPSTIEVAMFAAAQELVGSDSVTITLPAGATAGEVLVQLGQRCPELQGLLPACRLAVDLQYVAAEHLIAPGAQLALIPPVSGG
ncbi:ThiS family protein [Rosistilla ulvae]|uniref:Molybdopterin synthase sulfur carrier subunit n=1 Tax=Rosistilla ulvae TaxID=1930277 RepID=A0A517LV45_9BACT|nr:MoaD/ThiS family protein [Rosistilla ulvae]QDS86494.1 ThiS family protein [Rosistilla ulvae]